MYKNVLRVTLLLTCAITSLSAGVLTGDTVSVIHAGPAVGDVYSDLGTQLIPNNGSAASFSYQNGVYTANVYENYIDMNFSCNSCTWSDWSHFSGPGPWTNAVVITRLSDADFTAVTIDATTAYPGFNASRLSFTANQIYVELKGLSINGFIRLNLEGETFAPAPEPATMSMLGGGFLALGIAIRRRRPTQLQ